MLAKATEAASQHLGDAVPQAPWDFSPWSLKRQGHAEPGTPSQTHCLQGSRQAPRSQSCGTPSSADAKHLRTPSGGRTTGPLQWSPFARSVSFC